MTTALLVLLAAAVAAEGPAPVRAPSPGPPLAAPLPGAAPYLPELLARLEAARAARPSGERPRTRHLLPDGRARYTNRLMLESSPYLLQHAHNPVNWYPWGDEAFAEAKRRRVPVLLSVGYSTCHWCHVMEEESFEDEEIARVMNQGLVAIKVDREERPDLDAVYMRAVQSLTGQRGGWPMTVWLTPDRQPFYGATYLPARDGDRGAGTGFLTLLRRIEQTYAADPERVAATASEVARHIQESLAPPAGGKGLPGAAALRVAAGEFKARFDATNGGIGGAPKFPSSLPVRWLLRYHRVTGDADALRMALVTLEKMAAGGIHDQAGGGFHRYATDGRWLVPHFEKMLYDNALLAIAYVEAYQATGREDLATVARDVLRYVERDMTSPDGAFYAATDADSLTPQGRREEGWFFTWTPAEFEAALGKERARIAGAYFGVTPGGNFEGRNILHVERPLGEVARELNLPADAVARAVAEAREVLYRERAKRPPPLRDEKVLAGWNGLMISAFARAALALGDEGYARVATRAADFVLKNLRGSGRLKRSFKDGRTGADAYLDDHAFLAAGLLDLFEASGERRWLAEAIGLDRALAERFEDRAGGGFFLTGADHETLIAREKPSHDGAEPSGNSVAVLNLLRLHELTGDDAYRRRAERALQAFEPILSRSPQVLSEMLIALDFQLDVAREIVIVVPHQRSEAEPLLARLRRTFVPNRVLVVVTEGADQARLAALVPLVADKTAAGGRATAYVCERRTCALPTSDPAVFARQLEKVTPLR